MFLQADGQDAVTNKHEDLRELQQTKRLKRRGVDLDTAYFALKPKVRKLYGVTHPHSPL